MKLAWIAAAILAMPLVARTVMNESSAITSSEAASDYWVYVGTAEYHDAPTKSLYLCRFNSSTGALNVVGVAAETANSGFLVVNPSERFLYAVNELGEYQGQKNGAVSSFQINRDSG